MTEVKFYSQQTHSSYKEDYVSPTILQRAGAIGGGSCVLTVDKEYKTVRRLTELECERCQGLPDYWTLIDHKSCTSTARYKAIGNGMSQPCADFVIRGIVREKTKQKVDE